MSEKTVEAVARAISPDRFKAHAELLQNLIAAGDPPGIARHAAETMHPIKPVMEAARAAIEAYEAEKTRELLAVQGSYAYLPNDDMMHKSPIEEARGNPSFHNKWLNEVMDRLAGCKK